MWLLSRLTSGHIARRVVVNWSRAAASGEGFGLLGNVHTWIWTAATRCAPRAEPVFFPLDEQLELLPGELSATLAEGVARLGTKLPFEQAVAEVAFFWGVELEEATVRRHPGGWRRLRRGATQGERHALGARSRRSTGGTAQRGVRQPLARGLAAHLRTASNRG